MFAQLSQSTQQAYQPFYDEHAAGKCFAPQSDLPVVSEQRYNDCLKHLGGAPAPPYGQTTVIVGTSALEGTDPTLLAVTWLGESWFRFHPVSNYRPEDGGWDVGPLQTSTTYYNKDPFTTGLHNPFGTVFSETEAFNGNAHSSMRVGARALNEAGQRGGRPRGMDSRADAAGIFRAGRRTDKKGRADSRYTDRVNLFNKFSRQYDAFFKCLRG